MVENYYYLLIFSFAIPFVGYISLSGLVPHTKPLIPSNIDY